VRVAHEAGHEVMVCSLTRAAAAEIAGRDLPLDAHRIGTLHSHAYRALAGNFTGVADTPKFIAEWNAEYPDMALTGGLREIDEDDAAPYEGDGPGDVAYNQMGCLRARMVPADTWLPVVRRFSNVWNQWKKDNDLIDFTDMLEIALDSIPIAPGNPDAIFLDEAQDMGALEMALLNQWGRKAGRLVVVGDPQQCLYQWRGSDPAVFFEGEILPNNQRVLAQSYRVSKAVHRAAMHWITKMPGYDPIEYRPTEAEGLVSGLDASINAFSGALPVIEKALSEDKSVMILASCAYMLNGVLKTLRDEGLPFHNEYRRKNGAWNPLARRGSGVTSSDRLAAFLRMGEEGFWTRQDLHDWLSGAKCSEILPTKQSYKKFEPALMNLNEGEIPYGLVEALIGVDAVEHGMASNVDWYIDTLQSSRRSAAVFPCNIAKHLGYMALKQRPQITVGTIHSTKGSEADVVVLAPDLSSKGMDSWENEKASIYRLFYVGLTRAKDSVYILNAANAAMRAPGMVARVK